MDRRPLRDFAVGLFVLAGIAALAYLSLEVGGLTLKPNGGLKLYADFDETGGLKPRAPVVIGGVKVGEVTNLTLTKDFRVRVEMALMDVDRRPLELSTDTWASIFTEGVLGDRYVNLQPGGEEKLLKSGDTINHTESATILERLIGKLVYSLSSGSSGGTSGGGGGTSGGTTKP
jgi:phospholipid/cholesterol/gamma-HCH transport system substrate-binding protein